MSGGTTYAPGTTHALPLHRWPPVEAAVRLYPDSAYLQGEWLRAIRVVRSTSSGWLLDAKQGRKQ